jgi:hypothetical protein
VYSLRWSEERPAVAETVASSAKMETVLGVSLPAGKIWNGDLKWSEGMKN